MLLHPWTVGRVGPKAWAVVKISLGEAMPRHYASAAAAQLAADRANAAEEAANKERMTQCTPR